MTRGCAQATQSATGEYYRLALKVVSLEVVVLVESLFPPEPAVIPPSNRGPDGLSTRTRTTRGSSFCTPVASELQEATIATASTASGRRMTFIASPLDGRYFG